MSENLSALSGRKGLQRNLFEALGVAAETEGTPSPEMMAQLADEFLFGKANVYGTTSFYDFLKPENRGKKAYLCDGSACLTAGTQGELKRRLGAHFDDSEMGVMRCLGRCHENNAFHCAGKNYSGKAIEQIEQIKAKQTAYPDDYAVSVKGAGILTAPSPGYDILKNALQQPPETLLEQLKTSGLRGRGGAGFPTAFKLEACRNAAGTTKFIVCNADEGDPGAFSDRYIMEHRPHSLLMGMILAGYVAGASWGVVYIRGEYPESIVRIRAAVEELQGAGLSGKDIFGSGFSFEFKVIAAQGAYICGEETALLSSIEGQRPEVRVRPPYPAVQGLFNQPTVVSNVETLANIPWIAQHGGAAFARIGTAKSTGTKLISLDGHFHRPGICEVDMGTPLSEVIHEMGGGFRHPVKALHIGGPLGGLVPVHKIALLSVDFDTFSKEGFLLGHASVVCIPEDFSVMEYLEHLFEFTAHESCGKCFPCRLGSTRGHEMLQRAREGSYRIDRVLFQDLLETMATGSLCALGGGLPLPVRNAMEYFDSELSPYFLSV